MLNSLIVFRGREKSAPFYPPGPGFEAEAGVHLDDLVREFPLLFP
jgi:hypothetical protein